MRYSRIKNEPTEAGYYHAICRTIGKAFLFESEEEKGRLLLWLRKAVDFCGVELRAWCLMSNHVHLLVKVPPRREVPDDELLRRMQRLYLPKRYAAILQQWDNWRRIDGDNRRVDTAKSRLRARMYDISWFMKTFKQAVAQDYNERHDYSGSIWGGSRFKSVYLQGSLDVQLSVAAYIHLNPVRAGIVASAESYRWSSWHEACAAPGDSRTALLRLYNDNLPSDKPLAWRAIKAQLAAIQSLAKARTDALAPDDIVPLLPAPSAAPKKPSKAPLPPPLAHLLATKAPVLTASPLLGDESFIHAFFSHSPSPYAQTRLHRKFVPVAAFPTSPATSLCTLADLRLGRPRTPPPSAMLPPTH